MNAMPMGKTRMLNVLVAPAVVAARALSPRRAHMTASVKPTTTCELREMITGHASVSNCARLGRVMTGALAGNAGAFIWGDARRSRGHWPCRRRRRIHRTVNPSPPIAAQRAHLFGMTPPDLVAHLARHGVECG